ncbi:MAG: RagB/SusD family nutrient uptake outer membrane protein [Bacteroidales bacterium]|nr:RagB/SusD family nutrient uptake outer membrane protein [Bacteroidales bacterium]
MKKIMILLSALAALVSCNLEQYPYSEVAAADYVRDAASVNNLVMGAYNGLYDVIIKEWAMTELRTDNVRMRVNASNSAETKLLEALDQGTQLSDHTWVDDYWNAAYVVINRANGIFPYLDKVSDGALKAQYEGEARFLRSWMYFNLVRLWGPVFLVTSGTSAEVARWMQRSPVEDVYAQIEEDLETIVDGNLLPETMPAADLGRATLLAAKSMLAKVYMTHYKAGDAKYAQAKTLLGEVLTACKNPSSGASMVKYADIFSTKNECNAEIIFAVRYKAGRLGIGAPFSTLFGPLNNANVVVMGSPKHYNFPSDDLIAAFDPADKRKDVTLKENYYNPISGVLVEGASGRYCNKFIDPDMTAENDAETDWPVIRLADVMLLYAEASNELEGPSQEALTLLNAVRQRAGLPDYSLTDLASKYTFRMAVRQERRVEFAMENQRWFDLMRWGVAVPTVNNFLATEPFYSGYDYVVNPISEWQVLLPIPVAVLNVNKEVAQNPGY